MYQDLAARVTELAVPYKARGTKGSLTTRVPLWGVELHPKVISLGGGGGGIR